MIVKMIITRKMQPGKEHEAFELLKQIRQQAVIHKGYLTGETLINLDTPEEVIVVSVWESQEDWRAWMDSEKRKEINARLHELLVSPATYKPYVFSKYWLKVKEFHSD